MKNIAVILASGVGKRAGGDLPKQFRLLPDGRSVLETCVDAFEKSPSVDHILIVSHPDYISLVQQSMLACGWQKIIDIVPGGAERWQSSFNAVSFLHYWCAASSDISCLSEVNVLLHDCARPFVSQRILSDVCDALLQYPAVTVAVPAVDTMYVVQDNCLVSVPPRTSMFRAQTPQAFRLALVYEAYLTVLSHDTSLITDDIGVLRLACPDRQVYIVQGEENNRKLTFNQDFA